MTQKAFDDSNEPMPYRVAVIGLILGSIGLTLFSVQAGMSLGGVFGFIVIFTVMAIGCYACACRIRSTLT